MSASATSWRASRGRLRGSGLRRRDRTDPPRRAADAHGFASAETAADAFEAEEPRRLRPEPGVGPLLAAAADPAAGNSKFAAADDPADGDPPSRLAAGDSDEDAAGEFGNLGESSEAVSDFGVSDSSRPRSRTQAASTASIELGAPAGGNAPTAARRR